MFGFFRKKKEEKPAEKIFDIHPLLGKIKFWDAVSDWQTITGYKFCIFNKVYEVCLYINEEEKNPIETFFKFNEEQETAIKVFLDSIDELQELAEKELSSFFKGVDPTELAEKIEIQSVTITEKGDICLPIESSFDDSILEFIPEDALFTDSFGMVIYPEIKVFANIDDYASFENRE